MQKLSMILPGLQSASFNKQYFAEIRKRFG